MYCERHSGANLSAPAQTYISTGWSSSAAVPSDARGQRHDLGTVLCDHTPGHGRKASHQSLHDFHQRRRKQARRRRARQFIRNRRLDLRVSITEQIGAIGAEPIDVRPTIYVGDGASLRCSDEAGEHAAAGHVSAACEVDTAPGQHSIGAGP